MYIFHRHTLATQIVCWTWNDVFSCRGRFTVLIPVLKRIIYHARDLWKLTPSCKKVSLLCPTDPWNLPSTALRYVHIVRPFWYQYPFKYPCQFPCPSQRSHSSVLFCWTVSFLVSFLYFGRQNTCLQLFRSTWKILFAAGVRHLKHFHRYCRKICWSCVTWHADSDLCGE